MITIRNEEKGSVFRIVSEDRKPHYVYVVDFLGKMYDDYVDGHMNNVVARGLLADLHFTPHEIFRAMERLQLGKGERMHEKKQEVNAYE
jgi:hypothetical protein